MLRELKKTLRSFGFAACSVIKPQEVSPLFRKFYDRWLEEKPKGVLNYLENNKGIKYNVSALFPEAKSLIVALYPYYHSEVEIALKKSPYKIARYAWGFDYHHVVKEVFSQALFSLGFSREEFRVVVDSTPVNERYLARGASLGFIGRNGMLIHPKGGSYFFIALAFTSRKLRARRWQTVDPRQDMDQWCRNCHLCVKACPTSALRGDGTMKVELCLSYLTIENRGETLEYPKKTRSHRWVFGCDICQQVCPYNKRPWQTPNPDFRPHVVARAFSQGSLCFSRKELRQSALSRAGKKGLKRNLAAVEKLAI
ncbi:MAG: DUF1730 domain-containing protein [Leptospiraceae bacterium]|nr:DUF1730 domain-containing protein [Leptospiraceae bacterium]MDW8306898.1 DUF1730 domain-containing protein [Leptospiraceae bacterium]